mmetsp:Transcript_3075/g.11732  ORF Transcript_3075/g.11732 Transcript_3075/m.11732 type:complete len:321 (-) Transcript_3075:426-1388(-)
MGRRPRAPRAPRHVLAHDDEWRQRHVDGARDELFFGAADEPPESARVFWPGTAKMVRRRVGVSRVREPRDPPAVEAHPALDGRLRHLSRAHGARRFGVRRAARETRALGPQRDAHLRRDDPAVLRPRGLPDHHLQSGRQSDREPQRAVRVLHRLPRALPGVVLRVLRRIRRLRRRGPRHQRRRARALPCVRLHERHLQRDHQRLRLAAPPRPAAGALTLVDHRHLIGLLGVGARPPRAESLATRRRTVEAQRHREHHGHHRRRRARNRRRYPVKSNDSRESISQSFYLAVLGALLRFRTNTTRTTALATRQSAPYAKRAT